MSSNSNNKVVSIGRKQSASDFPVSKEDFDSAMGGNKEGVMKRKFTKRSLFFTCSFLLAIASFVLWNTMLDIQRPLYISDPQVDLETLAKMSIEISRKASFYLYFSAMCGLTAVGLLCLALITKIAQIEIKVTN